MSGGKFPWTDESVALLKELYAQDATGSEIARTLSVRTGFPCTRNAVIGKRVRLGLKQTPDEVTAHKSAAAFATREKRKAKTQSQPGRVAVAIFGRAPPLKPSAPITFVPAAPVVPDESMRCGILELTDKKCRWVVGDVRMPLMPIYCGAPGANNLNGEPYCKCHRMMAYNRAAA
jgi:hypothetical protein